MLQYGRNDRARVGIIIAPLDPPKKDLNFIDRVDMALGRISVKIGKVGKGGPHAKYILAAEKYAQKQKEIKFTSYGNLPSWAKDNPTKFFEMADAKERKNGQAYREHILSLPRELNLEQQKELLADWIDKRIGNKHAYLLSIHSPTASDGKEQPHAHLMYNQRINDGIDRDQEHYFKRYNAKNPNKGGCQKADTGLSPAQLKANLLEERQAWELTVNKHLEMNGFDARVDLRNHQERGAEPPNNIDIWDFKELQRLNNNLDNNLDEKTRPRTNTNTLTIKKLRDEHVNHVGGAARTPNASRWPPTVVHFVIILNILCNYKIGVKMGWFWGLSPLLDTLETNEPLKMTLYPFIFKAWNGFYLIEDFS